MSFGHDFNPFMPPFAAKREIRVRETELIHTLGPFPFATCPLFVYNCAKASE